MHKLRKYLFLTILIFFKISSWSYVYNLKPNDLHIELGKIKNGYVCTKTNLENFSQLIFLGMLLGLQGDTIFLVFKCRML